MLSGKAQKENGQLIRNNSKLTTYREHLTDESKNTIN